MLFRSAQRIAERIRNIVETTSIQVNENHQLFITVSIGIIHQNLPDTPNLQYLVNQADQALYQAKQSGRNQVILAS